MRCVPCASLRLHSVELRHLCMVMVLGLCVSLLEAPPSVAYAWPRFLTVGRHSVTAEVSGHGERPDRTAAQPPTLLVPGKAERAEQARALWQEVEAKSRLSPCWKRSLLFLRAKCDEVQREDTMRSRLALFMATCDADSDGRVHPNFHCGTTTTAPSELSADGIRACVQSLSDTAYVAFLQYRLHSDVLCAYLQEELYQERTEAAVAAMLRQMEDSTEVLGALQQSGAEVVTLVRDTQTLQRAVHASTASLQRQLDALHEGHAVALQGLRAAAEDILATSTRTDIMLGDLQTHIHAAAAEALASVEALSLQSLKQLAAVEEQTRGVMQLMAQVDHVQRLLSRQSFSRHRVLGGLGWVTAVLIVTTVPQTAAARLPAVALALLATAGLPLLQWSTDRQTWLLLRTSTWQGLCAALTVGVVCVSAYRYTPPEMLQRRVVREEAERVWRERRRSTDVSAAAVLQPYMLRVPPSPWTPSPPRTPARMNARRSPSPTPTPPHLPLRLRRPPSIAVSPQPSSSGGEEDNVAAMTTADSVPRPPPPSSLLSASAKAAAAGTARKRRRPAAATNKKSSDDDGGDTPAAKTSRAEAAAPSRESTAAKPQTSKRTNSKTPKKRG